MKRCYIQLGRTGDILNVLPMLWADAQAGKPAALMVAKEYASILDGVSYLDPVVFDGEPHDLRGAVGLAKAEGFDWLCTQVNAPEASAREFVYEPAKLPHAVTTSFAKEQWRVAGRLAEFGQHPLVFDRRDLHREEELFNATIKKRGKFILLASNGISSPFPYCDLLAELAAHCGYAVVDLAEIKAERFYDLLGLYEPAVCLIATDSAPLHLAYAVPRLPVMALVNDRPLLWNGSSWRPQHEFYCRYHDFPARAVQMIKTIRCLRAAAGEKKIIHLWNALGGFSVAHELESVWKPLPIFPGMCARLGPPNKPETPYLRDCLRMALLKADRTQAICVTGPRVQPIDSRALTECVTSGRPVYAYRMIKRDSGLEFGPIADLFCAPSVWWREHFDKIPDLLFSNDYYWRHCLWALFQSHGGQDITPAIQTEATAPKTGATLSAAATHNSPIADAFIRELKVTSRYPKVTDQLPCRKFEAGGLKPFGYNPTILAQDDMFLMAYRYHPDPRSISSRLVISQIDLDGGVLSNREPDFNCKSGEDPKLFKGSGLNPWLSYVASSLPSLPARAVVRFTELVNGKPQDLVTPNIGRNDETAIEKNWVIWWYEDRIAIIYQCSPTHQVYRLHDGMATLYQTPAPRWPWGMIKGGTPPIEFDGKLLRFFHSTTENEFGPHPRRYYVGALLMESDPPFRVLRVGAKPVLCGSEIDDVRVKDRPPHWKANVVFPGGAIARGAGWVLAVGVNDCQCVLAEVGVKDLHL